MRFEVPQFIEIEDKIFGPFTWKQFVYLVGGGGALFIIYSLSPFFILTILLGGPIIAFACALAFYKYNERPFIHTLEAFVGYLMRSKLYLWKKENKKVAQKKATVAQEYVPPSASSLASMARKLEINALQNKH